MKKTKIIAFFGISAFILLAFSVPKANTATPVQGSSADALLVGTTSFGSDLDPHNAWDSYSFDIIQHVCEGLFAYDLNDEWLRIVPRLTADCGTWSDDNLEFTVTLREGVTFHNGNPFDADVVKASFDRLNHLVELGKLQTAELYEPLDYDEDGTADLVIKEVVVVDEFIVKFKLNYPYAPFADLLCSCSSFIVDSSIMPANDIIPPNGSLVGTGPYRFMGNDGEKVEFVYYENYYRGVPAVKNFTYIKYESATAISTALLAGDVHMGGYNPEFLASFEASEILTVENLEPELAITYMGMNNKQIDKTIRHAISYAMDYRYIIGAIYRNSINRMTSIVPPGIRFSYPQEVAIFDLDKARQILIDNGLSKGLDEDSEDSEWVALAESEDPIVSYNYTYNVGNIIREDIGIEAQYDLKQIGINVELMGVSEDEFLAKLYFYRYELQLYSFEWRPDYKDPSNYINPLFSNTSMLNSAQVNDPWLQEKMMEALPEFNMTRRALLYCEIQNYIATDLMAWVFIGFNNAVSVHSKNVTDLQRNVKGYFYVFPLTWYGDEAIWDEEGYCNYDGKPIDCPEIDNFDTENGLNYFVIITFIGVGTVIISVAVFKAISFFRSKKS